MIDMGQSPTQATPPPEIADTSPGELRWWRTISQENRVHGAPLPTKNVFLDKYIKRIVELEFLILRCTGSVLVCA